MEIINRFLHAAEGFPVDVTPSKLEKIKPPFEAMIAKWKAPHL
jgi:hypothetical protein